VARRAVDAFADECWKSFPELIESDEDTTPFEEAWGAIVKRHRLVDVMGRADRLMSMGKYAVILLGFNDTLPSDQPVIRASDLLYVTPYSEESATISAYNQDQKDSRFGLPEMYQINVKVGDKFSATLRVHHSRVIHIAENCLENNIEGTPRLEAVLNRLQDLEKVAACSAEGFWQFAFPGMQFIQDPAAPELTADDKTAMKTQVENFIHKFTRYLALKNIEAEQFTAQVADPTGTAALQIDLIAAGLGMPKRILLGSERGELSSSQDERGWADKIRGRQNRFCGPVMLEPLAERLIMVGVLPAPVSAYALSWQDPLAPSDKEKADIAKIRVETLAIFANALGAGDIVAASFFLKYFLSLSDEEILLNDKYLTEVQAEEPEPEPLEAAPPEGDVE